MSTRDANFYGSFEDWFLANIDADTAHELRRHGAACGVGGLCYYSDTVALFDAFGNEIERLATDDYDMDLWQIAKKSDAGGITQLINSLVWIAAERLAHQLEDQLDAQQEESDADQEVEEGEADED